MKDLSLIKETMSSVEIARLTGKEHKTVMRDIRNLIDNLKKNNEYISVPVEEIKHDYHRGDRTQYKFLSENTMDAIFNFCIGGDNNSEYAFKLSEYTDKKGEKRPQYELNKKSSLLLASGYDILLRARIIDRWEELETQSRQSYQVPSSFSEALMLAARQAEELEKATKQIAVLTPKADFADMAFDTDGKVDIGQAAKILNLGYGRNTLFKRLRKEGVFFANRNEPKQRFVDAGYFELKEQLIPRGNHPAFTVMKVFVTQKGLAYINLILGGKKSDGKLLTIT